MVELGLDGISRVSTYYGPTLGGIFLLWVLPSPLLEDGSNTGNTVLRIDNSEMAAVVEVVFIYTRADLEGTPNTITKGKRKEWKENKLCGKDYNKQEQS